MFSRALTCAEAGDFQQMVVVAMCYASGEEIEQNLKLRDRWLERAAQADDPAVLALIGELYDEGRFVERNTRLAEDYYRRAGKLDRLVGAYMLGRHYYSLYIEQPDPAVVQAAYKHWRDATMQGHVVSRFLAHLLERNGALGLKLRLCSFFKAPYVVVNMLCKAAGGDKRSYWRIEDLSSTHPRLVSVITKRVKPDPQGSAVHRLLFPGK